jgi:hypothetical protein
MIMTETQNTEVDNFRDIFFVQQEQYTLCPTDLEVRGNAIRWTKARHLRCAILSLYFNNCVAVS